MIRFHVTELNEVERALRSEVREFLAAELPRGVGVPGLGMNGRKDPIFSQKLGAKGWLGMALPARYGGQDRSAVERLVVTEELLRWGAPVGHHWVADRQTGPVLARFGTEEQKQKFLPAICRGEVSFAIGMSETDSGSDLASISTKATRDGDGWIVEGRKIWTTLGHVQDYFVVLCRTTPADQVTDRRQGLSQLIVDLRSPGVTAHAIPFIDGTSDFCEVVLDEVYVPDSMVLGEVGSGWTQNTSELAFERGGPDRWLSSYMVVEEFLRVHHGGEVPDEIADFFGMAAANFWVLHNMTMSIARSIDSGGAPSTEAALVKEMGTRFEQDVVNAVLRLIDFEPNMAARSLFEKLLVSSTLTAPSFTIRGGTNEILRSVAVKGLHPIGAAP